MSKRTKKVGRTGWMGPRYGIRVRRRVLEIDRARDQSYACPKCSTVTLRRSGSGIYECHRCHTSFASDAYVFHPAPALFRSEEIGKETPPPEGKARAAAERPGASKAG
ncbi:Ribosomal protein L37ae [mine drainage metagenome]|uniref:Ribosomal protein L37ae n=1 Tax=mine drainage metagenome TaxID=410659 RepID=T1BU64_9ZZZZ